MWITLSPKSAKSTGASPLWPASQRTTGYARAVAIPSWGASAGRERLSAAGVMTWLGSMLSVMCAAGGCELVFDHNRLNLFPICFCAVLLIAIRAGIVDSGVILKGGGPAYTTTPVF